MTGIELHVAAQYYDLVEKYRPEKLLKNQPFSRAQVRTNALIRVFAASFEDGRFTGKGISHPRISTSHARTPLQPPIRVFATLFVDG
jgi:hypothetical protein